MAPAACPRCGAPTTPPGRFCTACGWDLRVAPRWPRSAAAPPAREPATLLAECPVCGATNASSRARCGRCHADLDAESGDALAEGSALGEPPADQALAATRERVSAALLLVTMVAAALLGVVVLTLLGARGIGPLAEPPQTAAPLPDQSPLPVVGVSASSQLPAAGGRRSQGGDEVADASGGPASEGQVGAADGRGSGVTYRPENLIDGDSTTAWNEGARGDGEGEWVELRLAGPMRLGALVIWNGYQKGAAFQQNPRVRTLRIDAGARTFTVELLDARGAQAVTLPEPVSADRVRLTIVDVYPGARYRDAALSDVEVLGEPDGS